MQSSTELAPSAPSPDEALLEKIEELSMIRELNDRLGQAATYNAACQMLVDMVRDERGADAVEFVAIDSGRRLARLEASAPDEPGTQDTFDADLADETIARLAAEGVKDLLVVPLGFVSDHFETLYEIDRMYGDLARSRGVERFVRAPSLNDRADFVEALASIVLRRCP